jgi:hypothetical protein
MASSSCQDTTQAEFSLITGALVTQKHAYLFGIQTMIYTNPWLLYMYKIETHLLKSSMVLQVFCSFSTSLVFSYLKCKQCYFHLCFNVNLDLIFNYVELTPVANSSGQV